MTTIDSIKRMDVSDLAGKEERDLSGMVVEVVAVPTSIEYNRDPEGEIYSFSLRNPEGEDVPVVLGMKTPEKFPEGYAGTLAPMGSLINAAAVIGTEIIFRGQLRGVPDAVLNISSVTRYGPRLKI